jgi:hypothetical protein
MDHGHRQSEIWDLMRSSSTLSSHLWKRGGCNKMQGTGGGISHMLHGGHWPHGGDSV